MTGAPTVQHGSGSRSESESRSKSKSGRRLTPKGPTWLKWAKPLVFAAGLYPLGRLILLGLMQSLSANPIEFITRSTGLWTLIFICITLSLTPVRRMTGFNGVLRFRRMIGLFAFFYALLHFTTYFWFDQWFDLSAIWKDVFKRPFITVGFSAFVLLIPLAITSPKAMVRRLGKRWSLLHRLIYVIAVLAILHFWWMKAGKHDLILPEIYAVIVAALLAARLVIWARRQGSRAAPAADSLRKKPLASE